VLKNLTFLSAHMSLQSKWLCSLHALNFISAFLNVVTCRKYVNTDSEVWIV